MIVGVPEVVVREAVRKLRRELEDKRPRALKVANELRQLRAPVVVDVDVDAVVAGYETDLRQQLSQPGWSVLPLPAVDHQAVLSRLHSGGAPASGEGVGYQDILIWETLKEALPSADHVVLVSTDGDFRGDGETLDAELAAEAAAVAPETKLELYRHLKPFVMTHLAEARLDTFWTQFDLYAFEEALAHDLLGQWLDEQARERAIPTAVVAWISGVIDTSDVELSDVAMLEDGQIALEMRADVQVLIEYEESPGGGAERLETYLDARAEARWNPATRRVTRIHVNELQFTG